MERVPGKRPNSCLYKCVETGHLYRRYHYKNNKVYMTCVMDRCSGSGYYVEETNIFHYKNGHIHEPNQSEVVDRQFLARVKERIEVERGNPRTIYDEERLNYDTTIEFKQIKRTMQRYCKKFNIPTDDIEDAIQTIGEDGSIVMVPRRRPRKSRIRIPITGRVEITTTTIEPEIGNKIKPKLLQLVKQQQQQQHQQQQQQQKQQQQQQQQQMSHVLTSRPEDDEFSYFGNNVACQLRKLPLNEALNTQREIMEVLAKQRIAAAAAEEEAAAAAVAAANENSNAIPMSVHCPEGEFFVISNVVTSSP